MDRAAEILERTERLTDRGSAHEAAPSPSISTGSPLSSGTLYASTGVTPCPRLLRCPPVEARVSVGDGSLVTSSLADVLLDLEEGAFSSLVAALAVFDFIVSFCLAMIFLF